MTRPFALPSALAMKLVLACALFACSSGGSLERRPRAPITSASSRIEAPASASETHAKHSALPANATPHEEPALDAKLTASEPAVVAPAPALELPELRAAVTRGIAAGELPGAAVAPAPARELPERRAAVTREIAAGQLPGAVVAMGRRDGLVLLESFGDRSREPSTTAMRENTIFDLASLTKPIVTATLVMQLVEQEALELDAPASQHLPELATRDKRAITLRQLLLHTSGLPHVDPLAAYERGKAAALAEIAALPLGHAPGARFVYSDVGYILLGEIVERVLGASLAEAAQAKIFAPLGMRDTFFLPDESLRDRIAPTQRVDARRTPFASALERNDGVILGRVHDPRAVRLGGVAGHAGLFSTAHDLARFARMLLGGGQLDGTRVLSRASVRALTEPHELANATRTLGWDVRSAYSKLRGQLLSHRAFGHGGYTGTSLWIDPAQDLFVIFLSHRVHPEGKGYVLTLAGEVADLASRHVGRAPLPKSCHARIGQVKTGIDVLREQGFAPLRGKRVALVMHRASTARDGTSTLSALRQAEGVTVAALFSPEHGLESQHEGRVQHGEHAGIPVFSLFGKTRTPTAEMLQGVDTIVFDLQDVGTRFYTYFSTLRRVLEGARAHGKEVMVLDRPNPLGGARVDGPMLAPGVETFVNYHPLPVRHGLTAGEMARLLNDERKIGAQLQVIAMQGYARELEMDDTGLPWIAPSPNLPDVTSVVAYPALGLLESTNVSVGRGTDRPFGFVGAPWIDAQRLLAWLEDARLPGVRFVAATRTPSRDRFPGKPCHGVDVVIEDARAFEPVRTALTFAAGLLALHPNHFAAGDLAKLLAHPRTLASLQAGAPVSTMEAAFQGEECAWELRRAPFLLYPRCDESDAGD